MNWIRAPIQQRQGFGEDQHTSKLQSTLPQMPVVQQSIVQLEIVLTDFENEIVYVEVVCAEEKKPFDQKQQERVEKKTE